MSAATAPVALVAERARPGAAAPLVLRTVAFAGLACFAALQWSTLVRPHEQGRLVAMVAVALALAAVVFAAERLPRWPQAAIGVLATLAALAGVLMLGGLPRAFLQPSYFDDLANGIGSGFETLPGITVPYRGLDAWARIVILAGGGALLLWAALLAARAARRGARPLGAAIVLSTVYGVATVVHTPGKPFGGGLVFALLLGAMLWAHRVERAHAPAAVLLAALAGLGGLALGPAIDGKEPLIDYEHIAEKLTTPPSTSFNWNHGYGPLDWPRDGREIVRVSAKTSAYWKAADLSRFDGIRWRETPAIGDATSETEVSRRHPEWFQTLTVSIRNLKSLRYLSAGYTFDIERSPRLDVADTPGTFATGSKPLVRGDAYEARVYTPKPSIAELTRAGTEYPDFTASYLRMELPQSAGGPSQEPGPGAPSTVRRQPPLVVGFLPFAAPGAEGDDRGPAVYGLGLRSYGEDLGWALQSSAYGRVWDLVKRLRAGAKTPYEFVSAVEDYLGDGFTYTETPPRHAVPLASFILDDKQGYCQQFSGAMALMLRMGGVPARVSSGFTTGIYDTKSKQYVARDLDAHSWVEVYFPHLGWVTFDPTPATAPPRGQIISTQASGGGGGGAAQVIPNRGSIPSAGEVGTAAPAATGSFPWTPVIAIVAIVAGLGLLGVLLLRLARRLPGDVSPEIAELVRALRRTGREAAPPLTLVGLEARFARGERGAAEYVAAVRAARYAGGDARPTAAQRDALRRELGAGLGPLGRLRAWWALPPG